MKLIQKYLYKCTIYYLVHLKKKTQNMQFCAKTQKRAILCNIKLSLN